MKKTKENNITSQISKDIIQLKFKKNNTFEECQNMFYDIMRKYNIKQGIKVKNGILKDNFAWTMCFKLFTSMIESYFIIEDMFNTPEDLDH